MTTPMLYLGMLFSTFAMHTEDQNLYSINYNHMGAPKTWYGASARNARDLEEVVRERVLSSPHLPAISDMVLYRLLRSKTAIVSPALLRENGVPIVRGVRQPGEFVITLPRVYHWGFSHGFNCAEVVNFATPDWFQHGEAALERYTLGKVPHVVPLDYYITAEMTTLTSGGIEAFQEEATKTAFVTMYDRVVASIVSFKGRGTGWWRRQQSCDSPTYARNVELRATVFG